MALLKGVEVMRLVDVRTVPRSRTNPQFNRETLPDTLAEHGIAYTQMPGLGGLRKPASDSQNTGWRNESFRGYADYMQTPAFETNMNELIAMAERERCALMCAEAVPWRCHRSLIADALLVRGWQVEDIQAVGRTQPLRMTPFAQIDGTRITYPPEQPGLSI